MYKTTSTNKEKNWSDLGETWLSCSGIHPEALTQVTPKSDKSISQHLGSSPSLTALLYSVSQTILAEIALFFSSQTSSLIPFLLCHGQNLTCFDLFCFKNTFVKCYLIQLLLKILLLLIPLSLNLLYFPLCSTGGLLVTRLPSG